MDKAHLTVITFLLAFSITIVSAGCGGESGPATHPVRGTVLLDGEPVADGRIAFRDPEGKIPSSGGKIENGEFSFESLPGTMQVEITAHREIPGEFDESNPGERIPLTEQYIPRQYNVESELTEEVKPAGNEFTFELSSDSA